MGSDRGRHCRVRTSHRWRGGGPALKEADQQALHRN